MKKILIVEDDNVLREELKRLLITASYEVVVIHQFEHTLEEMKNVEADLILLDINLPVKNGEQILREFRKTSSVPVIMITSFDNESDEVLSMSYGADDYITKPYNPTILLLRIEAIFKRMEQNFSHITYENIKLIPDRCMLKKEDEEFYLTKNEMLIFKYLLLHQGVIVSREDLMRYLWDSEEFIDDNTLSVNISRLRSKLVDVSLENVIVTKKGIGYLLK